MLPKVICLPTKLAIRIKKSKKTADYFIIQPMPTGVECKPNGHTLGWVVHFFRKSVSFPFSAFPFSAIRGMDGGRFFYKILNIYINIYIYIYIKFLSLPKNAYNGKRKSGKVENYP